MNTKRLGKFEIGPAAQRMLERLYEHGWEQVSLWHTEDGDWIVSIECLDASNILIKKRPFGTGRTIHAAVSDLHKKCLEDSDE
jgi:hypothetical protein